ncbi:MAG: hypothetical protein CL663_00715 [Bacteroidetes bacterium]|nr:hypothetical protein [Bacteroidota bacterium]
MEFSAENDVFIPNGDLTIGDKLHFKNGEYFSNAIDGVILSQLDGGSMAPMQVSGLKIGTSISGVPANNFLEVNGGAYFNGDIGIGTTDTFGYKLAVNGTIGAKEIVVETTSAWPDYVFASDYELRSLDEVENYIEENQHLPDVPSAAEVEESGISLGEMNATLLQKVEELTLYIIQQQKELDALKKEVKNLKK